MREFHTFASAFMVASRLLRAAARQFHTPPGEQLWTLMMPNACAGPSGGGPRGVRPFGPQGLRLAASHGATFPPIDAGALLRRSAR